MSTDTPLDMLDLIRIKEADVKKLFDPKIFERGVRYYEQGRVLRPLVYKKSIMAECQGTMPENYYIRVDIKDNNIVASCTCPYAFGYCKHIAAVLYAWLKKPSMFKDLGESEELLKRQEKSALVEMVIDMIRYDPDVVYVINLRLLPGEELPGFVQREMDNIFSEEFVDYLNVREIVKKLDIFREYAADLQATGDRDMGMKTLVPVIEAVVNNYTNIDDTDGLMRNFFATLLDLYGDIIPAYRMEGERRRFLTMALEWYMLAEWGMEDIIRDFLRKETERLKERRFVIDSAELMLGDYERTGLRVNPNYSEERDYVDERILRLNDLISDIKAARMPA